MTDNQDNGRSLLLKSLAMRDYSGTTDDLYAQLLMTITIHIGEDIYALLVDAEKEGKRLAVKEIDSELYYLQDELTVSDIILV